jgi:hypothetical protein
MPNDVDISDLLGTTPKSKDVDISDLLGDSKKKVSSEPSSSTSSVPSLDVPEKTNEFLPPLDFPGKDNTSKLPDNIVPSTKDKSPKEVDYINKIQGIIDQKFPWETPSQRIRSLDSWRVDIGKRYESEFKAAKSKEELDKISKKALDELDSHANDIGLNKITDKNGDTRYVVPESVVAKYQKTLDEAFGENPYEDRTDKSWMKAAYNKLGVGSAGIMKDMGNLVNFILPYRQMFENKEEQDIREHLENKSIEAMNKNASYYEEQASDYLQQGHVGKAIGALSLNITEQVPMLASLFVGGGEVKAGKAVLGALSSGTTISKYKDLEEYNVPESAKIYNSLMTGLSFYALGEIGGNQALKTTRNLIEQVGEAKARESLQMSYKTLLQNSAETIAQGTSPAIKGFAIGASTQITNNLVEKATINPNKDETDGVVDAGLTWALMDKAMSIHKDVQKATDAINVARGKVPKNIPIEDYAKAMGWVLEKDNLIEQNVRLDDSFQTANKERINDINDKVNITVQPRLVKEKINLLNKNINEELVQEYPDVNKVGELEAQRQTLEDGIKLKMQPEVGVIDQKVAELRTEREGLYNDKSEGEIQKNAKREEAINKELSGLLKQKQAIKQKFYDEALGNIDSAIDTDLHKEDKQQAYKELKQENKYIKPNEEFKKQVGEQEIGKEGSKTEENQKTETIKGGKNATQTGQEPKNDQQEHQNRDETWEATKTGDSNSSIESGQVEAEKVEGFVPGKTNTVSFGDKSETDPSLKRLLGVGKEEGIFTMPITREGKNVGEMTYQDKPEGWQMKRHDIDPEFQKQGIGTESIRQLNVEAQKEGKVVLSDKPSMNNGGTVATWERLVKSGEAEKLPDGAYKMKPIKSEKTIKEKAQSVADIIRKGKINRPDIFATHTPASLVWDGAIEVAAKTVEAGGDIAQAIADGIEHIKKSDWYKSFDKKEEAEKAFENYIKSNEQHQILSKDQETTGINREIIKGEGGNVEMIYDDPKEYEKVSQDIEDGLIDPYKIAFNLANSDSPATARDLMALKYNKQRIISATQKCYEDFEKAQKINDIDQMTTTRDKLAFLYDSRAELDYAVGKAGSHEWHRMGLALQGAVNVEGDYSLSTVQQRHNVMTMGEKLDPSSDLVKLAQEHERINKELTDALNKEKELSKEKDEKISKLEAEKKFKAEARKQKRVTDIKQLDSDFEDLAKQAKKIALGQLSAGINPELVVVVSKMAFNRISKGAKNLEQVVDDIYQALDEKLSKRDIRDAFSGYKKETEQRASKDEIFGQLNRYKREAILTSKLEDVQAGIKPEKRQVKRIDRTQKEKDLIRQLKKAMFERGFDYNQEGQIEAYKKRIKSDIEGLEEKIKAKDYVKTPRRKPIVTPEINELMGKRAELQDKIESEFAKIEYANRTKTKRVLDLAVKFGRAVKLASFTVYGKLAMAAMIRNISTPAEMVIGEMWSHVPGMRRIGKASPLESNFSTKALADMYSREFSKEVLKESWKLAKTGKTRADMKFGKKDYLPKGMLDFIVFTHAVVKNPVKEGHKALARQLLYEHTIRNGVNVSDPVIWSSIEHQAYDYGMRSILMSNNLAVKAFKSGLRALEMGMDKSGPTPATEILAAFTRTNFPIIRVPTNIVAETFNYSLGLPKALLEIGARNISQLLYYFSGDDCELQWE